MGPFWDSLFGYLAPLLCLNLPLLEMVVMVL